MTSRYASALTYVWWGASILLPACGSSRTEVPALDAQAPLDAQASKDSAPVCEAPCFRTLIADCAALEGCPESNLVEASKCWSSRLSIEQTDDAQLTRITTFRDGGKVCFSTERQSGIGGYQLSVRDATGMTVGIGNWSEPARLSCLSDIISGLPAHLLSDCPMLGLFFF